MSHISSSNSRPGRAAGGARRNHSGTWLALLLALGVTGEAFATCGAPLNANNFGRPIDYYNPREKPQIQLVEKFHFTPKVEALLAGESSPIPDDLHYTLRHIPNHPRALDAMSRWQVANRRPATAAYWEAECYFERAIEFRPEDATLYLLYGIHLHRKKELDAALVQYQEALRLEPDRAETHYNIGLLHFDRKDYAAARAAAIRAYELGYPLAGLRNRLKRVGEWKGT